MEIRIINDLRLETGKSENITLKEHNLISVSKEDSLFPKQITY